MAEVWLARFQGKHGFEKLVAVKTILPVYAGDQQFRQMFLDEATIASRIEHTHVAQILDLGEQEGILYLVMEWVEGDSVSRLERVVQQAGSVVPQAIALRIIVDACAGLHAAHELSDASGHSLGVVHRDVSPQNILINAKGVVKVIDFGIAKARDRAAEETRTGVFKGKLHYMAPEQALGKVIDRRADVWAIAAVLYRLLSQRYVYDAGNRVDTLRLLTTNAPHTPLPIHVPKSVAAAIEKALCFEPNQRQSSCAELAHDLERAIANEALATTGGELSAFVTQHLGERIDARRRALNASLQALGHQAAGDSSPAGDGKGRTPETASEAENTQILGPAGAAGVSELSSEPTRLWTPNPHESSFNTRSTFVEGQRRPSMTPARRRLGAVLAGSVVVVAIAGTLWYRAASRVESPPTPAAVVAQEAAVAPTPAPESTAAPSEPVHPAEPSSAPAPPEPAVVSVDSLPLTEPPPSPSPAPSKPTVKVRPKAGTSSNAAKTKRKYVDDGF